MSNRPRILVVEDDPTITDVMIMILEDEGYVVATAGDGAAALAAVAQDQPALILLDMRMPVLDGPAFVAAYRQCPTPHAPIVVLTASRDPAEAAAAVAADGVLAKPFNIHDLLALVRQHVGA